MLLDHEAIYVLADERAVPALRERIRLEVMGVVELDPVPQRLIPRWIVSRMCGLQQVAHDGLVGQFQGQKLRPPEVSRAEIPGGSPEQHCHCQGNGPCRSLHHVEVLSHVTRLRLEFDLREQGTEQILIVIEVIDSSADVRREGESVVVGADVVDVPVPAYVNVLSPEDEIEF